LLTTEEREMGVDQTSLDRIRNATFPTARRGYDKGEVERFLARLADWLETGAGEETRSDAVKQELERVGQRTGKILAQAEESGQQIRAEAESEANEAIQSARAEAEKARAEANAFREETIAEAEEEARRMLVDASRRGEDLQALIDDLSARRDEIVADVEGLAQQLMRLAEESRPGRETLETVPAEPIDAPLAAEPADESEPVPVELESDADPEAEPTEAVEGELPEVDQQRPAEVEEELALEDEEDLPPRPEEDLPVETEELDAIEMEEGERQADAELPPERTEPKAEGDMSDTGKPEQPKTELFDREAAESAAAEAEEERSRAER